MARAAWGILGLLLAGCVAAPSDGAPGDRDAPGSTPLNVAVTAELGHAGGYNIVGLAAHPTDPRRLLAATKDFAAPRDPACPAGHEAWLSAYASEDGGATWRGAAVPGRGDPPAPDAPTGGRRCASYPVVGFDGTGGAYYAGRSYGALPAVAPLPVNAARSEPSAFWILRSPDGDARFEETGHVSRTETTPNAYGIASAPGGAWLHAAWSSPTGPALTLMSNIKVARSPDGGATWSAPQVLGDPAGPGSAQRYATVAAGRDGKVFAAWRDGHDGNGLGDEENAFWLAMSGDQGGTWSAPRKVVDGRGLIEDGCVGSRCRVEAKPRLAVDASEGPRAGRVYLAWYAFAKDQERASVDDPEAWSDADVLLAWSDDDGATWSSPKRVNDDATTNDQAVPEIAVGLDGAVHLAFLDLRDDPANVLAHVYHARVVDGVVSPNRRVSEVALDYEGEAAGAERWVALAVGADGRVHVGWTDTRHGGADLYVASFDPTKP